MFGFAKNKQLFDKLNEYLNVASDTFNVFSEAVSYMLANGIDDHFAVLARKTAQQESAADDIRREIETFMYEKALLPETREDLLNIIENIDKIPNQCEILVNIFMDQRTKVNCDIKKLIIELTNVSGDTFRDTIEATKNCFGRRDRIKELNALVDKNENIGDDLERKMISKIFSLDLKTGEKILQKELIISFGAICDLCKSTLDRIVICSVKHQV